MDNIIMGGVYIIIILAISVSYYRAYISYDTYSDTKIKTIEQIGLQVKYQSNNINIFKILSEYIKNTKKSDVKEYTSLDSLKNKWLSDLDKYDNKEHIIILSSNANDGDDKTTLIKNYNIQDILKEYDPTNIKIYKLNFTRGYYILTRIF